MDLFLIASFYELVYVLAFVNQYLYERMCVCHVLNLLHIFEDFCMVT